MKLIIDIGNTLIKIAIYKGKEIVWKDTISMVKLSVFQDLFSKYKIESCIISCVGDIDSALIDFLNAETSLLILDHSTALPFKNLYSTPRTLGRDRLAAIAAASINYPSTDVLIIDAGTCITYDFINEDNEYLGGGISPGLLMRFKALNTFTSKLPLVNLEEYSLPELIGGNTTNSILSGVVRGFIKEIEGNISDYMSLYKQLKIIVTGGDHKYFDKLLKYKTFASPNLVLEGLNGILDFNEEI